MALIQCPECGKEISNKVKACPHCGYPIEESLVENINETTLAQTGKGNTKNKKILGIAAIIVVVIGVLLCSFITKQKNEADARSAYIANLKLARTTMLVGGVEAEKLCSLTRTVWYNSIFEKFDVDTDRYTRKGLDFNDFNQSIANLYDDENTKETLSKIKTNQQAVDEIMKNLQNPTEEFNSCYETVTNMYDAYQNFTTLAFSPSGNLESYSNNIHKHDSDFMQYYNRLETQIPDN